MLNKQEAFNTAYKGVIAQGGPSTDEHNSLCMYRSPEGRKCGVGHLIPDDKYSPAMEGCPAKSDMVLTAIPKAKGLEDAFFLRRLQGAHDAAAHINYEYDFITRFKYNMARLAAEFNLEIPNV